MSQDYNFDFSDDEGEDKSPEKEDEQQMQKINGLVESYQKQLSDIQENLERERAAHDETKKSLSSSPMAGGDSVNELRGQIIALKEAHEAEKKHLEDELGRLRNAAVSSPSGNPSRNLKHKIDTLCKLFAIEPPYSKETSMTERDCLAVLDQIASKNMSKADVTRRVKSPQSSSPARFPSRAALATPADDSELQKRITNLEEELRLALGAAEDIRALKAKVIQLVERLRIEKEDKISANLEVKRYGKKMEMLGDHVEKLMLHLKHEAGTKIKVSDQLKDSERRNNVMQEKITNLTKKLAAKDRLIAELREGSKILEDQLRLMDEKYLELRTKLDYTRDVGAKKIKKAQKVASDLRVKFALAGNSTLLDHIPMPSMAATAPAGGYRTNNGDSFDFRAGNDLNALMGPGTTGGKLGKVKKHGKSKLAKGSGAWEGSGSLSPEETEQRVLEKVRKLQGGKTEWTDEKIRELINHK